MIGIKAIRKRAVNPVHALSGAEVICSFSGIVLEHLNKTCGHLLIANIDACIVTLARNQREILVAQRDNAAVIVRHPIEHGDDVTDLHARTHHAAERAVRFVNAARKRPSRLLVELSNERMHHQHARIRAIAQLPEIVAIGNIR